MSQEIDIYEVWEEIRDAFAALQQGSKSLKTLERLLKKLERADPDDGEGFTDSWDLFSEGLNDAKWRADKIGPNALQDPEVFRLVHRFTKYDENLEVVLATSPHCPSDVREELAKSDFVWEEDGTTQALARNQHDPELLEKLAKSEDNSTRYAVAANPSTPERVLAELGNDSGFSMSLLYMCNWGDWPTEKSLIRYAVAMNPATSAAVMRSMRDVDQTLLTPNEIYEASMEPELQRIFEARDPSTPVALLETCATAESALIRAAVAANPSTQVGTLMRLATDAEAEVRRALLTNPSSTDEIRSLVALDN